MKKIIIIVAFCSIIFIVWLLTKRSSSINNILSDTEVQQYIEAGQSQSSFSNPNK